MPLEFLEPWENESQKKRQCCYAFYWFAACRRDCILCNACFLTIKCDRYTIQLLCISNVSVFSCLVMSPARYLFFYNVIFPSPSQPWYPKKQREVAKSRFNSTGWRIRVCCFSPSPRLFSNSVSENAGASSVVRFIFWPPRGKREARKI